ncbi:unnamed protein product [Phytophthora fragariaefolia]|uniref:Unnamed protein product n=1 Tax=Phytophthora fragariaefolia TaxID=1490495 RepID=A0A9W6YE50_9STRA|nr:unnamed protein product [Phytophthora fragariaefolia]
MCVVSDAETTVTMPVSAQRLCTRPRTDVMILGIATGSKKLRQPAGAWPPAGDAIERVDIGHAVSKAAAPVRATLTARRKMTSQTLSS